MPEQAIEQLEEHLLKAIDSEPYDIGCSHCWNDDRTEECESSSIEAINVALIALRAQVVPRFNRLAWPGDR